MLAKTSNTSDCLVAVNNPCTISIAIPNNNENRKAKTTGFKLLLSLTSFFKNKKQSVVKMK